MRTTKPQIMKVYLIQGEIMFNSLIIFFGVAFFDGDAQFTLMLV